MGKDQQFSEVIDEVLAAGAQVVKKYFGQHISESIKKDNSPVTAVDLEAQEEIIKIIKRNFPDHNIISEESPDEAHGSEYTWIIDPVDGTSNFINAVEFCGTNVALVQGKDVIAGGVTVPMLNMTFTSLKGHGAYLNGKPIKIGQRQNLKESIIVLWASASDPKQVRDFLQWGPKVMSNIRSFRGLGFAGMEMAYIACGKFDGYCRHYIKTWDAAAGVSLIREAGGKVWNFEGQEWQLGDTSLLAGNDDVVRSLYNALRYG